ncbi:hypothetical protein F5884DRAFT_812475 [Xylogone sp. PMI_703]|nr:hypothetical protein F5884DRAFT_812475 [Xylogone sp. PMI_703]
MRILNTTISRGQVLKLVKLYADMVEFDFGSVKGVGLEILASIWRIQDGSLIAHNNHSNDHDSESKPNLIPTSYSTKLSLSLDLNVRGVQRNPAQEQAWQNLADDPEQINILRMWRDHVLQKLCNNVQLKTHELLRCANRKHGSSSQIHLGMMDELRSLTNVQAENRELLRRTDRKHEAIFQVHPGIIDRFRNAVNVIRFLLRNVGN